MGPSTSVTNFTSTHSIMDKIFYSKPKDSSFIVTSAVCSFRFHPQGTMSFCGKQKKKKTANFFSGWAYWLDEYILWLTGGTTGKVPKLKRNSNEIYHLRTFNIGCKILQQSIQQLSRYFSLDQSGWLTDWHRHPSRQTTSWKQECIIMSHCPPGSAWTHRGKLATLGCQKLIGDIYTNLLFWGMN